MGMALGVIALERQVSRSAGCVAAWQGVALAACEPSDWGLLLAVASPETPVMTWHQVFWQRVNRRVESNFSDFPIREPNVDGIACDSKPQ